MSDSATMVSGNIVPDHVPPDVVRALDAMPELPPNACPFANRLEMAKDLPVFFNRADEWAGGAWIVNRAAEMRFVLSNPQIFSSKGQTGFSAMLGETWDMTPLELDPPKHSHFRELLNPWLSPPAVKRMEAGIRERCVDHMLALEGRRECEFMAEFGRPFPIAIVLQLLGLPVERMSDFVTWEYGLLHDRDLANKMGAAKAIRDYLRSLIGECRKHPRDGLVSYIVAAEVEGRLLTDDEILGTLYLLFVGGLDTVAASLGFIFRHLAENHDIQQRLRDNPATITKSVEEFIRRFSVVTCRRRCLVDTELGGVTIKAGDWVICPLSMGSLDALEFDCPEQIDLDRPLPRHFGFSFGPHFCMGSHLARREIAIALEEWLARLPMWSIKHGADVSVETKAVLGIEHLELTW